MSLLFGIDKNGKIVTAKDAMKGIPYTCPHCKAQIYKKESAKGNPFMCCYSGEEHTNSICRLLTKATITHTTEGFIPDRLFDKLLNPPVKKGQPSASQVHGGGTGQSGLGNNMKNTDSEDDPEVGVERPFTSLKQIWDEGLQNILTADTLLGGKRAADVIAFPKWFPASFGSNRFTGGPLIVQVNPKWPLANRIILFSASGKWNFLMKFPDETIFLHYLSRLLKKSEMKSGALGWIPLAQSVLIAGNWEKCDYKYPQFQCNFVNESQLYICPDL